MAVTFWEAFDAHLVECVQSDMAAGGLYDSLEVEHAFAGETFNVDRGLMPAVMVRGITAEATAVIHGDGQPHAERTYPYLLVAYTVADDYATAKRDGQELMGRMRKIVLRRSLYSVTGDDGERPTRIGLGREYLEMRGRQGTTEGRVLAVAALEFTVETEV